MCCLRLKKVLISSFTKLNYEANLSDIPLLWPTVAAMSGCGTQEPIPQSITAWPELSEQETCDRGSIAIGYGAVLDRPTTALGGLRCSLAEDATGCNHAHARPSLACQRPCLPTFAGQSPTQRVVNAYLSPKLGVPLNQWTYHLPDSVAAYRVDLFGKH